MDLLILIVILITLYLAFGIGSNDETMSSVVGSGSLSLNQAVLWGGFLASLGCIFLSKNVGKNIGSSLFSTELQIEYDVWMMFAIILSTSTWLVYASKTGAPISTTHSVVGSVIGVAFMWSFIPGNDFLSSLNWIKLGQIALGWVISPILGLITASLMQKLVHKFMTRKWEKDGIIGFLEIEVLENKFRIILLFFISVTQLSRGGNDSANAIGIYYGLIETGDIPESLEVLIKVLIGCINYQGYTGSELYVFELAKQLTKQNCEVTIVSNIGNPLFLQAKRLGIKCYNIQEPPRYKLGDGEWGFNN